MRNSYLLLLVCLFLYKLSYANLGIIQIDTFLDQPFYGVIDIDKNFGHDLYLSDIKIAPQDKFVQYGIDYSYQVSYLQAYYVKNSHRSYILISSTVPITVSNLEILLEYKINKVKHYEQYTVLLNPISNEFLHHNKLQQHINLSSSTNSSVLSEHKVSKIKRSSNFNDIVKSTEKYISKTPVITTKYSYPQRSTSTFYRQDLQEQKYHRYYLADKFSLYLIILFISLCAIILFIFCCIFYYQKVQLSNKLDKNYLPNKQSDEKNFKFVPLQLSKIFNKIVQKNIDQVTNLQSLVDTLKGLLIVDSTRNDIRLELLDIYIKMHDTYNVNQILDEIMYFAKDDQILINKAFKLANNYSDSLV